jgi:hypothetical protein
MIVFWAKWAISRPGVDDRSNDLDMINGSGYTKHKVQTRDHEISTESLIFTARVCYGSNRQAAEADKGSCYSYNKSTKGLQRYFEWLRVGESAM